jgi:hypothetical protein
MQLQVKLSVKIGATPVQEHIVGNPIEIMLRFSNIIMAGMLPTSTN